MKKHLIAGLVMFAVAVLWWPIGIFMLNTICFDLGDALPVIMLVLIMPMWVLVTVGCLLVGLYGRRVGKTFGRFFLVVSGLLVAALVSAVAYAIVLVILYHDHIGGALEGLFLGVGSLVAPLLAIAVVYAIMRCR